MRIPRPTKRVVAPVCAILGILAAWQGACSAGLVPNFMLPSPVQVVAALGLAGMILLLSILMGKRSSVRKPADVPYECGMVPMGEGAPMFSVKFYMVAMLFVIFDLEVVFLYPWAVNFRDYIMMNPESFTAMCIFIGILLVAYLYALGKGALNWHHDPR